MRHTARCRPGVRREFAEPTKARAAVCQYRLGHAIAARWTVHRAPRPVRAPRAVARVLQPAACRSLITSSAQPVLRIDRDRYAIGGHPHLELEMRTVFAPFTTDLANHLAGGNGLALAHVDLLQPHVQRVGTTTVADYDGESVPLQRIRRRDRTAFDCFDRRPNRRTDANAVIRNNDSIRFPLRPELENDIAFNGPVQGAEITRVECRRDPIPGARLIGTPTILQLRNCTGHSRFIFGQLIEFSLRGLLSRAVLPHGLIALCFHCPEALDLGCLFLAQQLELRD